MIQYEGKTHYSLEEAAEQTGYTKGTISNYLYKGEVDGSKLGDGQWVVSEVGIVQLKRRRKTMPDQVPRLITLEAPEDPVPVTQHPDPVQERFSIPDIIKQIPPDPAPKKRTNGGHPEGWKEGSVYIRTPEHHQKYNILKAAAETIGISVGDLNMAAITYYADHVIEGKLQELKALEQRKKDILAGMTN